MELVLEITSDDRHRMGATATKTFQRVGGTIGRDPECDWFIPDQTRHLSGQHAVVSYEEGRFCLTDVSTNGVYLNGSEEPVGRQSTITLNDADRLSMGNIDFVVRLQLDPVATPYKVPSDKNRTVKEVAVAATGSAVMPQPGGGGRSLDPLAVFRAKNGYPKPDSEIKANRFSEEEQSVSAPDHQPAVNRAFEPPAMLPEDWLAEPQNSKNTQTDGPIPTISRSTPPGPSRPRATRKVPSDGSESTANADKLLQRFFNGLGIRPRILEKVNGERVMEEMGRVLKANMIGMVEVMQQRARLKNEFRMDMTLIKTQGNNPLKFSADARQAIKYLFKPDIDSFLPINEAFSECYDDIQVHQLAVLAGVQSAMQEVLKTLSPERIEELAERDNTRFQVSAKASRCWRTYHRIYEDLNQEGDDFNRLFTQAFVTAYDKKVHSIRSTSTSGDIE